MLGSAIRVARSLLLNEVRSVASGGTQKGTVPFDHIEEKLKNELSTTFLYLKDVSSCNCGQKFEAFIVSREFEGMSLLERQRLVMSVLKDEMAIIHSFTQKTLTPKEWLEDHERDNR